jgi:hypothetical protein
MYVLTRGEHIKNLVSQNPIVNHMKVLPHDLGNIMLEHFLHQLHGIVFLWPCEEASLCVDFRSHGVRPPLHEL